MISDGDDPKNKFIRFDENNFHAERFLIQGSIEGKIACTKQLIARATHHTWRLVGRAIFRLLKGLYSDSSNFCIRTRIGILCI